MTRSRRTGRRALGLAAGVALVAARARAQTRDLTVVSWGGSYQEAQREVFFRPFQAHHAPPSRGDAGGWGRRLLRARLAAGRDTWDIVQVEGEELILGCEEGLFEPLDFDAIGGRRLPPAGRASLRRRLRDLCLGPRPCAPPGAAPGGWADLFDLSRFPGRRALRRGPKTNLEIALLGDGVPAAGVYATLATEAGVERAFRRLDAIREAAIWWEAGSAPARLLGRGEVAMAVATNGRIEAANRDEGGDLGMVWATSLTAMDSWVIARGSPNRAKAVEFLRFAGDPAVQAALPRRIPYGVTARGAEANLAADVLADLPGAPENARGALPLDEGFWAANIDRLERRFAAWVSR